PGLERPETARQIGAEIARPARTGGEASGLPAQIGRRSRKCLPMAIAVAHDEEAGVVGHLTPFVEIKRDRIRALKSCQPRGKHRRENPKSPEGAVDVKPKPLLPAQRA